MDLGLQKKQSPLLLDRGSTSTNWSEISLGLLSVINPNDSKSFVPWKLSEDDGGGTEHFAELGPFHSPGFFFAGI